jgi:hypothetical protein
MTSPLVNNEALFRVAGMWGFAQDDQGRLLAEVIEVAATATSNRIEVPIVGSSSTQSKPGRVTREGTFRCQKIDDRWEEQVWAFISASLKKRRSLRGTGDSILKPFRLIVGYDDPEALDYEKWQLDGCLLWTLPLGFSIGDDIRELEFQFTYENETPIHTYVRTGDIDPRTGLPAITHPHHE